MSEVKQPVVEKPAAPLIDPSVAALIKDIVVEARKPVKSDDQIKKEQEIVDHREVMRLEYENKRKNKAAEQNWCQHRHKSGVGSPVTYVANLNRLYCQHCALWIFPTIQEAAFNDSLVDPKKHPEMFDRLYQVALTAEAI